MDFENLIRFLIHDEYSKELFDLLRFSNLEEVTRIKLVILSFKITLECEAMTLGLKLFSLYEKELLENQLQLQTSLIKTFKETPFLLEFKLFFLSKLLSKMKLNIVEQILKNIEAHFFPNPRKKSSLLIY
jgi:hypothetical protein